MASLRSAHRPLRRLVAGMAAVTVAAIVVSGCTLNPFQAVLGKKTGFQGGEVTVQPLYVSGDTGGVAKEVISAKPSEDGDLRVDFSENEVNGFGDMTRAASWNAVTVTTLLTGAPLDTAYRFAFDGAIDGPSAGALTTVGVLSLYFGDDIDPKATMTGTINPTGTIGTVGGIPEKIQGVIDQGKITKVLIPAGQRNTPNEKGDLVDVVDLGEKNGVDVEEVATIYDAYEELTGAKLPTPQDPDDPKLSENGYDKLKSKADSTLARYNRAKSQFEALNPTVRALAGDLPKQASTDASRAKDLEKQGLQAGAFVTAENAAVEMEAVYNTFDTIQGMLLNGLDALDAKLDAASTANDEFLAQIDSYGTYDPKSLTDVEALTAAYGTSFDAYSLLSYANGMLDSVSDKVDKKQYSTVDQLIGDLILPLIYYEFARGQLQFGEDVFDIGRDNDGGPITQAKSVAQIGSFLRRGADANWAAFDSGVLQPNADSAGVSKQVFLDELGGIDLSVALSYSAQSGQKVLEQYIGPKNKNAAYAAMGYGFLNYARNAELLEKYYNNGILDKNLTVVDVNSDTILTAALDLGREQVARAVQKLDDNGTTSVIAVADYEQAGVDREGEISEKFDAIESYSESFLIARALAFAGGYQTEGWSKK